MKSYIILLCVLLVANSFAQDYQMILPERVMYYNFVSSDFGRSSYSYFEGHINAVIVDSAKQIDENVKELYFRPQFDNMHYEHDSVFKGDCIKVFGPSVMGHKLTLLGDSQSIFYNRDSVPLIFMNNAKSGEGWICYAHKGDTIHAIVDSVYADTIFNGIVDSVKRISLNYTMTISADPAKEIQKDFLLISKKHGALKIFNFRHFPDLYSGVNDFVIDALSAMELVGLTNPAVGLQNLTWKKIHDYEVGDVFHDSVYVYERWHTKYTEKVTKIIRRVISKTANENYFSYEFKRFKEYTYKSNTDSFFHSFVIDTIVFHANESALFDHEPGYFNFEFYQNHSDNSGSLSLSRLLLSDGMLLRAQVEGGEFYKNIWCPPLVDFWCNHSFAGPLYLEGLGMIMRFYDCDGMEESSMELEELVYYKKKDREEGKALSMDTTQLADALNSVSNHSVSLFPNPANDELYIKGLNGFKSAVKVKIYDLGGKLLIEKNLDENHLKIHFLEKGVYIIDIQKENHTFYRGKLIKN